MNLTLEPIAGIQTGLGQPATGSALGAIAAYLARQKSEAGRRTIRGCLRRLSAWCGSSLENWQPHRIGSVGVQSLVARIQASKWSPAYKALHETALSGILEECWAHQLLDADSMKRLQRWSRVKVQRAAHHQAAGRYITPEERKALWQTASALGRTPPVVARDQAYMVLLLCGLRREECVKLNREDLSPDGVLSVVGKGSKQRQLILDNWMMGSIQAWLSLSGNAGGALLRAVDRHGNISEGRWSVIAASKRFEAILASAGISNITPHDARRTFASDALAAGVDIALVARWMGHSDVRTTASYDRRGLDQLRAAAGTVGRPF